VTVSLALGCESGGREAGNKAPVPENPGRTEQTFEAISAHKRDTTNLGLRGVVGVDGRVIGA
jgi:hypothetical protein